ncbi:glycosyltransferase family 2 protein [Francisellaceae bacterium CB299]|jgi:glycosyltransferase involved in cell wall biosynthesis
MDNSDLEDKFKKFHDMNDNAKTIKFSVITVCYNSEATIERTLQSIRDQTYKNIEYIIIDGGSTDKTLAIVNKYKGIIDVLVSEPDNGIYDAMNKGAKLANGDYIGFLNSDDYYTNDIFEEYGKALVNKNFDFIYSNTCFFRKNEKFFRKDDCLVKKVYQYMPISHMSIYVKNSFVQDKMFDTKYKIAADLNFFNKLISRTINFAFIEKNMCYFSLDGLSSANFKTLVESRIVAINNNKNILNAYTFYYYKVFRLVIYNTFGSSRLYNLLKNLLHAKKLL